MHLALNGCVATRFKMLKDRGKMPLPQIISEDSMRYYVDC